MTRSISQEYWKVLAPALLAFGVSLALVLGIVLPEAEEQLLRQKKDMLASVTATAWNILAYYERLAAAGEMPRRRAQELAARQVRSLRYGPEGKDYFWINDLRPSMVMHPYRPELEGTDLGSYADRNGTFLFREMVQVARSSGSGFVEYLWQWKDEPAVIGPKVSYVRLFGPWGWIVGTGVYLDDIAAERRTILLHVATVSLGALAVILLVSALIIHGSLREVRRRMDAERALDGYRDRLEEMVKERTAQLQEAKASVKTLSGLLPICLSCKKIRDDKGYWSQLELYIRDHSEAEFSHGLCPDCAARIYPRFYGGKPPEQEKP